MKPRLERAKDEAKEEAEADWPRLDSRVRGPGERETQRAMKSSSTSS